MAESLESFKSFIGKSESATDVVTASTMVKFAATLGLENPPLEKARQSRRDGTAGYFRRRTGRTRCAPTDKRQAAASCRRSRCRAEE